MIFINTHYYIENDSHCQRENEKIFVYFLNKIKNPDCLFKDIGIFSGIKHVLKEVQQELL